VPGPVYTSASFLQRFGSALNPYVHFQCCVLDGVFDAEPASDRRLIERLAALIPPPRLHRHGYNGVLAPNAPLRATLRALARAPAATPGQPAVAAQVGGEGHWRSLSWLDGLTGIANRRHRAKGAGRNRVVVGHALLRGSARS